MALRTLAKKNYGGKSPVSIKCHNLHSLEEGVIRLCQNIIETRQTSYSYSPVLFTAPLSDMRQQ